MVCDLWLVDLDPFCQVLCVSVFQGSLLVVVIMIDGSEKRNCEGGLRTLEFACLWKEQYACNKIWLGKYKYLLLLLSNIEKEKLSYYLTTTWAKWTPSAKRYEIVHGIPVPAYVSLTLLTTPNKKSIEPVRCIHFSFFVSSMPERNRTKSKVRFSSTEFGNRTLS